MKAISGAPSTSRVSVVHYMLSDALSSALVLAIFCCSE